MENTAGVPSSAIVLEVLNQRNYKHWSFMVQHYLMSEDLWQVVTAKPLERRAAGFKNWQKKNSKALHAILISCGSDVFSAISSTITKKATAKTVWDDLRKRFDDEEEDAGNASDSEVSNDLDDLDEKTGHDQEDIESFKPYEPFMVSVIAGDWDRAKNCLTQLNIRDALMARDPRPGKIKNTALHAAIRYGYVHIVKELLQLMKQEDVKEPVVGLRQEALEIQNDKGELPLHQILAIGYHEIVKEMVDGMRTEALEIKDNEGRTPLGHFLYPRQQFPGDVSEGELQILKCMIEKNKNIIAIDISYENKMIPVAFAYDNWGWSKLTRYLYSQTPDGALRGPNGAYLICSCLSKKFPDSAGWDIVCDTIEWVPTVAFEIDNIGRCPIFQLLRKDYVFKSGTEFTCWQKWIYNLVEPANIDSSNIPVNIPTNEEDDECCQGMNLIHTVKSYYRGLVQYLRQKLGINRLIELKSMHVRIEKTIKCVFSIRLIFVMRERRYLNQRKRVVESIFAAVERGRVEFITTMCLTHRSRVMGFRNKKGRDIFGHAIECRQEAIYNLMYGFPDPSDSMRTTIDKFNNNWLHIAAKYSPLPRSNRIQGAYLQMQRELQWFKEVESVVPPEYPDSLNSDGMTPRELFTKTHKKLMDEAENSIKGTATSCTVVGALIITIMFAATFTVPGGNDDKSGMPKFIDNRLFTVFIASDTISLISSATSVIMFLGILTSRYSEEDYLSSLPQKMMIGLLTLFLSIVTMMIAFSTTVIMMVGGISWIVLSIFLTSVPVATYVKMQLPLFLQTFSFTYGRGIFVKNENWFKNMNPSEESE